MTDAELTLGPGSWEDAEALTDLFLRARARAMPWLQSVHDEADTRWWMEHVVLSGPCVWVARVGAAPLGFAQVQGQWLEHLYVEPQSQGRGVGRALLEAVKENAGADTVNLHVFARNSRARRFYEAAGFVLTDESDGSRNEERESDCTYTWSGAPG